MDNKLDFSAVFSIIKEHRQNAYRRINEELVTMYYEIGEFLSKKIESEKWGSKIIDTLSKSIVSRYPTIKGFNRVGLYRMVRFYETYRDNVIVSPLVTQLSWEDNLLILWGTKLMKETAFFLFHYFLYKSKNKNAIIFIRMMLPIRIILNFTY